MMGFGGGASAPGRGSVERWVRGAWGDPGSLLRAMAAIYGGMTDLRNGFWDAGVFAPLRVGAPVISVGALSAGGAGKTPLTAALARLLADAGAAVAVITPGQGDELALHAELNPDIPVTGGRWRVPLARRAVAAGASVVLLDSGLQHRRLHRDLELITCNVDSPGPRARLPAGPYRERFTTLRRADAVLLVRRAATPTQAESLAGEIADVAPDTLLVHVPIRPGDLRPANDAARRIDHADPAVAVAGVMWPESFFRSLVSASVGPDHRFALSDHARYDPRTVARIAAAAAGRGVVCTRKDAVRLAPRIPDDVPVWYLSERVDWGPGSEVLLAGARRVAGVKSLAREPERRLQ